MEIDRWVGDRKQRNYTNFYQQGWNAMKFDFKNYPGKYVMHCKTEEEAEDFCRVMHEDGRKWKGNRSYLEYHKWEEYGSEMCYLFNEGEYSNAEWYEENGYKILEWSDFMDKQFTKADLKDGMVGITREGKKFVWLCGRFRNQDGTNSLCTPERLNDDLTHVRFSKLDIMKVYTSKADGLNFWFDDKNLESVWQRPEEITEMTIAEIKKELGIAGILKIKEG